MQIMHKTLRKAGIILNINGIYGILRDSGYLVMTTNLPYINFFCKKNEEDGIMYIIGCIDEMYVKKYDVSNLDNISFQMERKFLFSGMKNVNIIFIINSDNLDEQKVFCNGTSKVWIIDTICKRLVVFENQPDDFDGLRKKIEILLEKNENQNKKDIKKNVSFKLYPWVTVMLMTINIIYFLVLEYFGSTEDTIFMLKYGALYYKNVFQKHEYYRLITCMFMHFGFAHLLNNMFSLYLLGSEAERFYGKIKYLIIYIISGLMASISSALYQQSVNGYSISAGASGAIYGIMGALLVRIVEERRKNMSAFSKMGLVLILFIMAGQNSGNVDNIAHIGGFVTGMLCGIVSYMLISRKNIEKG